MIERTPWSGHQIKRSMLVIAVVSMVVLSAGCSGVLTDPTDSSSSASQIDKVPNNAEMLVHVDMDVLQDPETQTLIAGVDQNRTDTIQQIDDLYTEFENETGLDLADVEQVTMFGTAPKAVTNDGEFAILVDADWDAETAVQAIDEDEEMNFVRTEYAGENVLWKPENPDQHTDPMYVGLHDDGQLVIGTHAAVTASLDVSYDGADPISGTLRDAFEASSGGHVTFAMDMSAAANQTTDTSFTGSAMVDGLQTISGSYYTENGDVGVETRLTFEESQQAENLNGTINLLLDQYQDNLDPEVQDLVENLDTETEGSALVLTWEGSVDTLVGAANQA